MKLIFCRKCQDIVRLFEDEVRVCKCGETKGKYLNNIDAVYSGDHAVPMGLNGLDMSRALNTYIKHDMSIDFNAFFIKSNCKTFKKVTNIE